MAIHYDTNTGYLIGETDKAPLSGPLPTAQDITTALQSLILSASGWRKVFAASGNEEDRDGSVSDSDLVLAVHMADVYADFLIARLADSGRREIALGLDSRPTGTALGDVMCRVFLARGFIVRYLFIASAPEIMAYAKTIGAFAYVSASHNPIGHNGVKFGLGDGGVLAAADINPLINAFRFACESPLAAERAQKLLQACPSADLSRTWHEVTDQKRRSLEAYDAFSREVISGEADPDRQGHFFDLLRESAAERRDEGHPVSILADFNGSARSVSIDRSFIESTGITLIGMNETTRQIAHRIVPEGESLSYCAREIERLRKEGKKPDERTVLLAYVPDCDGDRGNIVYWDETTQTARPLEAQEVFALATIAELSHLVYQGLVSFVDDGTGHITSKPPLAIAVNDPTSLRVESLAACFGARVARAEVGEANVVQLARSLRESGYLVRILGEGSNGGNITHPAAVRDPLNTVYAILKMIVIRDSPQRKGLFRLWCELSSQEKLYRDDFTLSDIIGSLPQACTTSVFESQAMLRIATRDHALLKRNFQVVFEREWKKRADEFRTNYGFQSYVAISNNGIVQTEKIEDFGLSLSGGLKIQFLDAKQKPIAYIWMRGSGTEPVFRILADTLGTDPSREKGLLAWLTSMVLEADRKIG